MRFLFLLAALFYATNLLANEDFKGVFVEQGTVFGESNTDYMSLGLFYLSDREVKVSGRYMSFGSRYSESFSLSVTNLETFHHKGLFYSIGGEVLGHVDHERSFPKSKLLAPVAGLGIFLTRRKYLTMLELAVHYPRIEVSFSVGY